MGFERVGRRTADGPSRAFERFRTRADAHPVAAFVLLTYAFSWLVWSPLLVWADQGPMTATLFSILGTFGPAVAAVVVTWLTGGSLRAWFDQVLRWRVPVRYYLVALLVPAVVVALGGALEILVLGGEFAPQPFTPVWGYPAGLLVVLLVFGGNEEPGWRGFALPRLQARYSPLVASLVIGVVWVGWHLPMFLVPGSTQATLSLPLYAVSGIGLSVLLTWLYNSTGGSVLLPMLLHASVNQSTVFYISGGGEAARTPTGYGLVTLVLVVVAVLLLVGSGRRLSRGDVPTGPPTR